jgi:peptidoglycan hydrolase CwlO-like protein
MTTQIFKYLAVFIVSIVIGGFAANRYYKPAIDSLEAELKQEREESREAVSLYVRQIDTLNLQIEEISVKRKGQDKKLAELRESRNRYDTSYVKNFRYIDDVDTLINELRTIYR